MWEQKLSRHVLWFPLGICSCSMKEYYVIITLLYCDPSYCNVLSGKNQKMSTAFVEEGYS